MDQAVQFRACMGQPIGTTDSEVLQMQQLLIAEEFQEFNQAVADEPEVNQLKELADRVYVCFQ